MSKNEVESAGYCHYTWNISDIKMVHQIFDALPGEYFVSGLIKLNNLDWNVRIYPNGYDETSLGRVAIFMDLQFMPSTWKSMLLSQRITLDHIGATTTQLLTFSAIDKCWGINSISALRHEDLSNEYLANGCIKFTVSINILTITLIMQENDVILYQNPLNYDTQQITKIKWSLDSKQIKKFHALSAKSDVAAIESQIYDSLWCLRMCREVEGYYCIFLKLVAMPPNVSRLTVAFTLTSGQPKEDIKEHVRTFSLKDNQFGLQKLFTVDEFKCLSSMDVQSEIRILNEFDVDGNDSVSSKFINQSQPGFDEAGELDDLLKTQVDSLAKEVADLREYLQMEEEGKNCGCVMM